MLPRLLGVFLIISLGATSANATTAATMLQRKIFITAEQAVNKGNLQLARQLKSSIKSYPLYPYLEYKLLKRNLGRESNQAIQTFLDDYPDTPLAGYLRLRWLNHLASKKRWQDYVDFYEPQKNIDRQCHYLNALIHTGKKSAAFELIEPLWLYGKSRPKACDQAFAAWKKSPSFTPDLTWQRIELSIDKGQIKLARYLGKQLPASDKPWVERWIKADKAPHSVLRNSSFKQPFKYKNKILAHAVKREIRSSVFGALDLWQQIQKRHQFDELETLQMNRKLAYWLMRKEDSIAAYDFIANVEPGSHDSKLQETRLRAGLLRQDWHHVLVWLDNLPAEDQATERWQYWRARALQQQGDNPAANKIFTQLADSRSYYGFSAADQVDLAYHFAPGKTPINQKVSNSIKQSATVARIEELLALDRTNSAKREWYLFTKNMQDDELMAAAVLAKTWDWHDQAIFTLARSEYWDDLELRFPVEHQKPVKKQARVTRLDPSWIYGIIRQESAFNAAVRSHAGAVGLMQLMPATARFVSKKLLKQKPHNSAQLIVPENNILLGTTYLRHVLDKLQHNPVLATAAYNAGPHRVNRWLPKHQLSADIWVELIPFKETRRYVQRVFTYASIYDHRLDTKLRRLSERMPAIRGTEQVSAKADTAAAL